MFTVLISHVAVSDCPTLEDAVSLALALHRSSNRKHVITVWETSLLNNPDSCFMQEVDDFEDGTGTVSPILVFRRDLPASCTSAKPSK